MTISTTPSTKSSSSNINVNLPASTLVSASSSSGEDKSHHPLLLGNVFLFKILLIGDSKSGKTAIAQRFGHNEFEQEYIPTIGVDFKTKNFEIQNQNSTSFGGKQLVRLQLWDSSGDDRFKTVTGCYYRGAHGIVIAIDLTSSGTFDFCCFFFFFVFLLLFFCGGFVLINGFFFSSGSLERAQKWLQHTELFASSTACKVLVGTKSDMKEEVVITRAEMESFAKKHGIQYIETSAKTGENVTAVFNQLSTQIIEAYKLPDPTLTTAEQRKVAAQKEETENKQTSSKQAGMFACCNFWAGISAVRTLWSTPSIPVFEPRAQTQNQSGHYSVDTANVSVIATSPQ